MQPPWTRSAGRPPPRASTATTPRAAPSPWPVPPCNWPAPAALAAERELGSGPDDLVLLDAAQASARVGATDVLGGLYTPHCARIHPAKLVRGLATAVRGLGVRVYEQTRVTAIEPGVVRTAHGRVRADVVVRATEGYTPTIPGHRRAIAPVYSLMLATAPLPGSFWDTAGWRSGRPSPTSGT